MQRFYAHIELAAEPFISNVGPHMFVSPNDTFVCGNNEKILGPGVMCRSSHHGKLNKNKKFDSFVGERNGYIILTVGIVIT
jgi:hypothetical protein